MLGSPIFYVQSVTLETVSRSFGILECLVFVLKVALLWCRRLGSPPRLAAGRLSAAGCKAGNKVGSAPWQFPADGLAVWGRLAPVGIAVALMRPADALAFPSGAGCGLSGT